MNNTLFKIGDTVKFVKIINHQGFGYRNQLLAQIGTVESINIVSGMIRVRFSDDSSHYFNVYELELVPEPVSFKKGDKVKFVKVSPGSCTTQRDQLIGQTGVVGQVYKDGSLYVRFNARNEWFFGPDEVELVPKNVELVSKNIELVSKNIEPVPEKSTETVSFQLGDKVKFVKSVGRVAGRDEIVGKTGIISFVCSDGHVRVNFGQEEADFYYHLDELEFVSRQFKLDDTVKFANKYRHSYSTRYDQVFGLTGKIAFISNAFFTVNIGNQSYKFYPAEIVLCEPFGIGDKVKFVKNVTGSSMANHLVGKIGVIDVIAYDSYRVVFDDEKYFFSREELDAVKENQVVETKSFSEKAKESQEPSESQDYIPKPGDVCTFTGIVQEETRSNSQVLAIVYGKGTTVKKIGKKPTHIKHVEAGDIALFEYMAEESLEDHVPATQAEFDKQEADKCLAAAAKWNKETLLSVLRQHSIEAGDLIAIALEKAKGTK